MEKMNVKLLKKVLKHIKAEPRRFHMANWARKSRTAPCGTQACIGGWAIILSQRNTPKVRREVIKESLATSNGELSEKVASVLGLSEEETINLCYTNLKDRGAKGVKIAEEKIKALIANRKTFVGTSF